MDATQDANWRNYANTMLQFSETLRIDLRESITREMQDALSRLSAAPYFAVISAADPKGDEVSERVNQQSASVLKEEIHRRGFLHVAVSGMSVDGTHCEPGFAVFAHFEEARDLAIASDQSAFFWYDGSAFWLMGALVDCAPVQLPQR